MTIGTGRRTLMVAAMIAAATWPAFAADRAKPRAPIFAELIECRSIAADAGRLACYDRQVKQLDQAEQSQDVVVVDRTQIRKARRSLFGLALPDLSIFGDRDERGAPDEEGVSKLESTIKLARQNANGRWMLTLEDGARWIQVDTRTVGRSPRPGMPIVIRKAAMGSFLANIDKQIAIRVDRFN
ncbi:hypothetical protein [Sphingomonas faeni]|uniref:hypothetical protein n=1 Tax=Sphingomonas faeni TaxID=185950 RepID=UPI003355D26F